MQKPSKLAQIPQIRFAGFTDLWERRKLGEVAEFNPKSELPEMFEYVDLESVFGTEMISHRTETKASAPSRAQRLAKMGDVFYQTVRPYQRNNYLCDKPDNNYVFSTGYAQMRPSIDSSFLMNFIQTDGFVKIVLDNCTGTSYPAINSSDLANLVITYPVNIKEQEKIGAFFSKLNRLITLHQSKFEKLQKIKKSCLQNLFPQNNQNTPKIRFKNFNDEWAERKADEICTIETGKSNTQDQNDNGKYPFYIRSDKPVRSNKFLYDCEAVITIGDGSIGKVFHYVKGKFDLHQRCYKMTDFKDVTGKYFYYYFSTKFYDRAMKMTAKATVDSVRLEMISNMFFSIPNNLVEQCKISEFFTKLDKLISLQQRKVEKLKNIKKALLNKMFI